MKRLYPILVSVLSLLIVSCGNSTVGVHTHDDTPPKGNKIEGTKTAILQYNSPFGFSLKYVDKLLFTRSEDQKKLTFKTPAETSLLVITVLEAREDLEGYLKELRPDLLFKPLTLSKAKGFYVEKESLNQLQGKYYVQTDKHLIIFDMNAIAFGRGLDWIAPIVHTFTQN